MRTMFVAEVAVLMFAACAKKAEENLQGESATPIQADTVTAKADVDSTVVKPEVDKSASLAK